MFSVMPRLICALFLLALAAYGQQDAFTDSRDSKKYKSVKIGSQTWMAENLNYEVKGFFAKGIGKCYENKDNNCEKYGRLYDWNTAKTACPKGWHLPSKEEWEKLTETVGGEKTEGKHLKAKSGWSKDGNGEDTYGFSALPGSRGKIDGSFAIAGKHGSWWSTSDYNNNQAYYRYMYYEDDGAIWYYDDKSNLFSVRCVQD